MLNVIILTGRLTREPQLFRNATAEESIPLAAFDIAVDNLGKDAGTTFLSCKAFGKLGEHVSQHLRKGSKVAVSGRIQQRTYLAKDGSKRSVYEVICDSVEFLDPKPVEPEEPNLDDIPEAEEKPVDEPKYDPYTGKPLKSSKAKK